MKMSKWVVICLLTVGLVGCAEVRTTSGGTVGVTRSQYMLISSGEFQGATAMAYTQRKQQTAAQGRLVTSGTQYNRLIRIANRIVPQVRHFRPDATQWKWDIYLSRDPAINASCMDGGKIQFNTGVFDELNATDDEIAAIMGHEVAHALREHGRERASQRLTANMGLAALGLSGKFDMSQQQLAAFATEVLWTLPHSREHESESDRIGLELMARAGYDPRAAPQVWRKLIAIEGNQEDFRSSHPSHATRVRDLEALLPRVMPIYVAAVQDRNRTKNSKGTPQGSAK